MASLVGVVLAMGNFNIRDDRSNPNTLRWSVAFPVLEHYRDANPFVIVED